MAFIPLVNGMRVALEMSLAGQLVVNVYHVTSDDPIATVNLEAVAEIFLTYWGATSADGMRGYLTTDIALTRVVVTDISTAEGEQYVNQPVTPLAGNATGDAVPNNVAAVISGRSTFVGRSRRGRNYIAGLPESVVVNNIVDAAHYTAMLNVTIDLVNDLEDDGYHLGVASFTHLGAPRATALFTPYTVISGDTVVDSQRRRLPGRGA